MMFYIDQHFHYKDLRGKVLINYVDKINRMLTLVAEPFLPHGHIVNTHGKGPLVDATYQDGLTNDGHSMTTI